MNGMRWHPDPKRPALLLLLAHGRTVARIEPHRGRHVVHVRYADVHVIAVRSSIRSAQRFAEGELWSGAGELPDLGWPGPCNAFDAAPLPARIEPEAT
jgi:hypothetical protein